MGPKKSARSVVPSTRPVRIVVADPYPVIVCGVRKMVEDDPRFQVVAEASTMPSFQKNVVAERPEVGLVDWSMASQDLESTIAFVQSDLHATFIIFLTVSENSQEKRERLRLGAHAFLSKWSSVCEFQTAVLRACNGRMQPDGSGDAGGWESASIAADAPQRTDQLTSRERQLLPLVCSGLKNKEIALRLGIAESTVWHHLTSVFRKLQVEDRLGLATFAYGHGLISPDAQSHNGEYAGAQGLRIVEPHRSVIASHQPRTRSIGKRGRSPHG
jgi:two-component system nitrate/nitrite response regulator NarL